MSFSKTALSKLFRSKTITAENVYQTGVVTVADAATITLDMSKGNFQQVTLGGNRTLGIPLNPNPIDGQEVLLRVTQDATGSRTLTLTTSGAGSFAYGTSPAQTALSTGANKVDYIRFRYSLASNKWHVVAYQLGY